MATRVYQIPSDKRQALDELLDDDALSRQDITIKDAESFGQDDGGVLLFLKGDEDVLTDADARLEELGTVPEDAEGLWTKLEGQEEEVAGGVGFIFGGE